MVVCGPTASGKSDLADDLADAQTEVRGVSATALVIDSMQVYREIPIITNQARRRPAEMVGIISIQEDWTVALHRQRTEELMENLLEPVILDAGTGMYLNAILLDIDLAPAVPAEIRERAERLSVDAANPRRETRARELALAGTEARGSIWEGDLKYETALIYLRPPREVLDAAISRRSSRIVRDGLQEAENLVQLMAIGKRPNPSVRESIGVRELMGCLEGGLSLEEALERIEARTRRLARRQMRWFDKLARTLRGRAGILIVEDPRDPQIMQCMHDIIGS